MFLKPSIQGEVMNIVKNEKVRRLQAFAELGDVLFISVRLPYNIPIGGLVGSGTKTHGKYGLLLFIV